jgi:arylsulfatase
VRRHPNLLFIFTDEQAATTMAAYGNSKIDTPNMDRLASDSIVFERAYVTQPVCTPSRSSLLTGLYPHTNGCTENNVSLPAHIPCLPELGDFSKYNTAYYGKWHLGDEIFPQHGFREWISIDDGYRNYYSDDRSKMAHSTYFDYLIHQGFRPDVRAEDGFEYFSRQFCARLPEQHGKPAYLAREACRFIRDNKDNPFMLYVNFFEPHMPYFGPRDDQYCPEDIVLPLNFWHELSENNPLKVRLFRRVYEQFGHSGMQLRTEDDWRRIIANYWGLVSLVDTYLGLILQTLEETGQVENTIIVFTSDHGDMMGSHRLLAKCTMFEEAIKVPLLLRIPDCRLNGTRVPYPISQIDLVPTLLEAMKQSMPSHLQGTSRYMSLSGKMPWQKDNVFIEWNGMDTGVSLSKMIMFAAHSPEIELETVEMAISDPVRTVITPDGWKYNYSSMGEHELYHLTNDPYEMNNLAGQTDYRNVQSRLTAIIHAWQEQTNDSYRVSMSQSEQ